MSWLEELKIIYRSDPLNRAMDDVDAIRKLADSVFKKDHKKLKPADFRPFRNSAMDRIIKSGETIRKDLDRVMKNDSIPWPSEDKIVEAYQAMIEAHEKYGKDSRQMRAALEAYVKAIQLAMVELLDIKDELSSAGKQLEKSLSASKALGKTAKLLAGAFEKCTRIPAVGGINPANIFGPLVLDAYDIENIAAAIEHRLGQIIRINNEHTGECNEMIANAKDMLKRASKHSAWEVKDFEKKSNQPSMH